MTETGELRGRQSESDVWDVLLTRWLASLPDAGWEGPVLALELVLASVAVAHRDLRHRYSIPSGTGLGRRMSDSKHILARSGWAVRIKRSRLTGRTFVFEKLKSDQ